MKYYFNPKSRTGRVELAILAGLIFAVFMCIMPLKAQTALASKLTRLHIIANSDSENDQKLKLQVRDAILKEAHYDINFTENVIDDALLATLARTAKQEVEKQGFDYSVKVERARMYFNTRNYDGFSLPAGNYDAVRVVIGSGEGKNWWCVLFPPLCLGAAQADIDKISQDAGLTDEDIALIKQDGTTYVLKFKIVELLGRLANSLK